MPKTMESNWDIEKETRIVGRAISGLHGVSNTFPRKNRICEVQSTGPDNDLYNELLSSQNATVLSARIWPTHRS